MKRSLVTCIVLFAPFILGCGKAKDKNELKGTVRVNGKALPMGTITVHPQNGDPIRNAVIDGEYSFSNLPTGDVVITVSNESIKRDILGIDEDGSKIERVGEDPGKVEDEGLSEEERKEREEQREQEKQDQARRKAALRFPTIPEEHGSKSTSQWKITIEKGENTLDIDIDLN